MFRASESRASASKDFVSGTDGCKSLLKGHRLQKGRSKVRRLILVLMLALLGRHIFGWPQDIAGGASSLAGQDIIGGASVVFKRPPRVRDLAGGASVLIARHRIVRKPTEPTEIARNKPPKPQPGMPEPEPTPKEPSNDDKAEVYNNQGNTLYDVGKYAEEVEAYKKALRLKPNDSLSYNNLGAA